MSGYYIDFDTEEIGVSEETYNDLTARGLIEFCEECSSEFSARCVAHPAKDPNPRLTPADLRTKGGDQ